MVLITTIYRFFFPQMDSVQAGEWGNVEMTFSITRTVSVEFVR